jgi:hypothetical protein
MSSGWRKPKTILRHLETVPFRAWNYPVSVGFHEFVGPLLLKFRLACNHLEF